MQGKIVKQISDDYTVISNQNECVCKSRGKFRYQNIKPLVGDIVDFDEETKIITKIYPRKNELARPAISNVNQALIVTSTKNPDFDLNLLDKLITIIEFNNITPIICLTKLDLLSNKKKEQIDRYRAYYEKIGYQVFDNNQIEDLKIIFKDKVTVFTGQTGAGKSSLLNRLNPDLNIKTNEISFALGRGKNTTTHTELRNLFGGMIADTPGFSDVSFMEMSKEDIRDNFVDFNMYRDQCKYRDCMHDKEDSCIIKEKVKEGKIEKSRYDNYLKFIR